MRIRIEVSERFPAIVTLVLVALILLLSLMSVFGQAFHYLVGEYLPGSMLGSIVEEHIKPALDVNNERSFPTVFAGMLLLLCSALLAGIALSRRAVHARYARHWTFLSVIFLYLFVDEILEIHEVAGPLLRDALGTGGLLYHAWVIPALILLLVLGVLYAKFVIALPARIRLLFLTAALLYVAGAAGLEMGGGYYASSYGQEAAMYLAITTVEEFLEMLGIAVFVGALLEYMRVYVEEMEIPPSRRDFGDVVRPVHPNTQSPIYSTRPSSLSRDR